MEARVSPGLAVDADVLLAVELLCRRIVAHGFEGAPSGEF
jgi:hypothetical protein